MISVRYMALPTPAWNRVAEHHRNPDLLPEKEPSMPDTLTAESISLERTRS